MHLDHEIDFDRRKQRASRLRCVVRIARDPTLFRFLSACGPDMRIVWEMRG